MTNTGHDDGSDGAGRTVPRAREREVPVHNRTSVCECGSVTMEDYAEAVITGDTYHVPKPNLFHRNRRCRVLAESDLLKLSD